MTRLSSSDPGVEYGRTKNGGPEQKITHSTPPVQSSDPVTSKENPHLGKRKQKVKNFGASFRSRGSGYDRSLCIEDSITTLGNLQKKYNF